VPTFKTHATPSERTSKQCALSIIFNRTLVAIHIALVGEVALHIVEGSNIILSISMSVEKWPKLFGKKVLSSKPAAW
jgi:hypothetical protein